MTITICPVTQNFAAEIGDVDLSRPLDAATFGAIHAAWLEVGWSIGLQT